MVEVNKSNFEELFPLIEATIRNASFIALDSEFTCLVARPTHKPSLFDSAEDRYEKLKVLASNSIICQLGLSAFTKCKDENVYTVHTYSFYLRPASCGSIDPRFLCQASSFDFLCKYGFDFNKFAHEGISYLNEIDEKQVEKEMHNKMLFMIQERFLGTGELHREHSRSVLFWLSKAKEGDKLVLEKGKGIHQYFSLHNLRQHIPSIWAHFVDNKIEVQKVSPERRKELEENVPEEERRFLNYLLGFTRVFRVLKESKKPIVGHNLLTDLFLIYQQFFRPLPKTYQEFKTNLHQMFPVVFDTKHIWQNIRKSFADAEVTSISSLSDLFSLLKRPKKGLIVLFNPLVKHLTDSERYDVEICAHEAGFDAYATGFVFLHICHIIAMQKLGSAQMQPQSWKQHLQAVESYRNKVNLIRANLHHISLEGKDPPCERPEWLHVQAKKRSLNLAQLNEMLSRHGPIEIKPISRRKALVAAGSHACAKAILRAFRNHDDLHVSRYSLLRHSRPVRAMLWAVSFFTGSFSIFLLVKAVRSL